MAITYVVDERGDICKRCAQEITAILDIVSKGVQLYGICGSKTYSLSLQRVPVKPEHMERVACNVELRVLYDVDNGRLRFEGCDRIREISRKDLLF